MDKEQAKEETERKADIERAKGRKEALKQAQIKAKKDRKAERMAKIEVGCGITIPTTHLHFVSQMLLHQIIAASNDQIIN